MRLTAVFGSDRKGACGQLGPGLNGHAFVLGAMPPLSAASTLCPARSLPAVYHFQIVQAMFTGIIEAAVPVLAAEAQGSGLRLTLKAPDLADWSVARGDSVAVSGACLTVEDLGEGGDISFDLTAETVARTWFGSLEPGQLLNLERALKLDARLDGHLVSGHVDGGAGVLDVQPSGDGGTEIAFQADPGQDRYLLDKGSVTLDGVSLTVISPEQGRFHVALIPLTLELTSLGDLRTGDRVNLEADMIGKWVERLLPSQG